MNKKLAVTLMVLAVVALGGYLVFKNMNGTDEAVQNNPEQVVTNATTSAPTPKVVTPVVATSTSSKVVQKAVVKETSDIILFYGEGCPHCELVRKYLSDNNVSAKLTYEMKEVYHNQENANQMIEKAKVCGMTSGSLGVPFLWDGTKCLVGDADVINFFKSKIGQ
jgi:glutaredoxin